MSNLTPCVKSLRSASKDLTPSCLCKNPNVFSTLSIGRYFKFDAVHSKFWHQRQNSDAILRLWKPPCLSAAVAELILVCPCIRVRLSWGDKTSVLLLFQWSQTGITVGADTLRGTRQVAYGVIFFFCSDEEKMTDEITIEILYKFAKRSYPNSDIVWDTPPLPSKCFQLRHCPGQGISDIVRVRVSRTLSGLPPPPQKNNFQLRHCPG